jgi:hypothetical protein
MKRIRTLVIGLLLVIAPLALAMPLSGRTPPAAVVADPELVNLARADVRPPVPQVPRLQDAEGHDGTPEPWLALGVVTALFLSGLQSRRWC